MQFSQNIHRFYQYINSIYIMMMWGYEIVLNKVGSIAFADTLEIRMCLFVKEHFHRLVKSRTHSEMTTARGRSAHEHFLAHEQDGASPVAYKRARFASSIRCVSVCIAPN